MGLNNCKILWVRFESLLNKTKYWTVDEFSLKMVHFQTKTGSPGHHIASQLVTLWKHNWDNWVMTLCRSTSSNPREEFIIVTHENSWASFINMQIILSSLLISVNRDFQMKNCTFKFSSFFNNGCNYFQFSLTVISSHCGIDENIYNTIKFGYRKLQAGAS